MAIIFRLVDYLIIVFEVRLSQPTTRRSLNAVNEQSLTRIFTRTLNATFPVHIPAIIPFRPICLPRRLRRSGMPLARSERAPSCHWYPATLQEQPLMYDARIPYSSEGSDALRIQQSMVSGNPRWDLFHDDPDTWCLYPSPPRPAINAFGQVAPLYSPWHMSGKEGAHNTIKPADNGAAQAMQHQFGCNPIGLCIPNMHVHFDYSRASGLYNSNWMAQRGVDNHPIQAQGGWVEDTTPIWCHHPSFACDCPFPQATSGFEPVPTTYRTVNGAPQDPEIDFSSDLPFDQAS
ncbi:hypothetical protein C2E23DRAFT_115860 [Lenzites betulinus]|nr:hypothetical protein C2E23DRAFT_115860 [Lenzites betulinus]